VAAPHKDRTVQIRCFEGLARSQFILRNTGRAHVDGSSCSFRPQPPRGQCKATQQAWVGFWRMSDAFEASRNAPERWIERGALVRGWIRK